VGCSNSSHAGLDRAFDGRAAILAPSDALVECLADETSAAARLVLDGQLDGRPLVAAVVNTVVENRSVGAPAGQRAATESMRRVLLWARLLTGAMADGEAGGTLVLVLPQARKTAGVVAAHGVIGIARSASVSLATQGVRTHVVDRADGDEATFATLVSVLASDELRWLSGHVLATSAGGISIFTDEEPLWQLFADTAGGQARVERVNAFVRSTNTPRWAPRSSGSIVA
jgi:hypothetical protein